MRETDSSELQNLPCVELYRQESSRKMFRFFCNSRGIPNLFSGMLLCRGQARKKLPQAGRVRFSYVCSMEKMQTPYWKTGTHVL